MSYKDKLKEIIKKVKKIDIYSKRKAYSDFSGEYRSLFRGQGMEFDQVRHYTINDDVRLIDWNVSARTGKIHVKTFHEERENIVFFIFDVSSSLDYASGGKVIKKDVLVQIMAMIAFSATNNNDKIGLLLFDDEVRYFLPPKKGRNYVLNMLEKTLIFESEAVKTDIEKAFDYFNRLQKKKAQIFLLTDMIFDNDNIENILSKLSKKHILSVIKVSDPFDENLENIGCVNMEDNETKENIFINTSSKKTRKIYNEIETKEELRIKKKLNKSKIRFIKVLNSHDFIKTFIKEFKRSS